MVVDRNAGAALRRAREKDREADAIVAVAEVVVSGGVPVVLLASRSLE